MADGPWKGVVAAPDSKKQATMTLEARPALREEERLGSRHLRVVQRHLLFLPLRPLRNTISQESSSISLHPSIRAPRSLGCRGNVARRGAHNSRCTGYNTTRNPRAEILLSLIPPLRLSSDSRTLLRDRRECLHLSPPAAYASPDASHKERFIVWRPPGAR